MATSAVDASKFVTPEPDSIVGQMTNLFDRVSDINQRNNAASAAQAAELRNWQVEQNTKAMNFNAVEAAKNRDWQEYMSSTAHQREVNDLIAAGLNPVLSAGGGNGASVGSGATASGVTSAGAKGETDTSGAQALVGLFSSIMQAQNTLEAARLNAENNAAIADGQNANARIIEAMRGMFSENVANINAGSAANVAKINADSAAKIQSSKNEHDTFMARFFPTTQTQGIAAGIYNAAEVADEVARKAALNYLPTEIKDLGKSTGLGGMLRGIFNVGRVGKGSSRSGPLGSVGRGKK